MVVLELTCSISFVVSIFFLLACIAFQMWKTNWSSFLSLNWYDYTDVASAIFLISTGTIRSRFLLSSIPCTATTWPHVWDLMPLLQPHCILDQKCWWLIDFTLQVNNTWRLTASTCRDIQYASRHWIALVLFRLLAALVCTAGRHFLNVQEMIDGLREQYGSFADVELRYLEQATLKEQIELWNNATVVVHMHGASLGNWAFLPHKAVGVHITLTTIGNPFPKQFVSNFFHYQILALSQTWSIPHNSLSVVPSLTPEIVVNLCACDTKLSSNLLLNNYFRKLRGLLLMGDRWQEARYLRSRSTLLLIFCKLVHDKRDAAEGVHPAITALTSVNVVFTRSCLFSSFCTRISV